MEESFSTFQQPPVSFPIAAPHGMVSMMFALWQPIIKAHSLHLQGCCSFLLRDRFALAVEQADAYAFWCQCGNTLVAGADAAEDDGYLVAFVYDEAKDKSDFVVYDAKTMSSTPLATVPLPVRVPHGFHGLWVGEQELKGAE